MTVGVRNFQKCYVYNVSMWGWTSRCVFIVPCYKIAFGLRMTNTTRGYYKLWHIRN